LFLTLPISFDFSLDVSASKLQQQSQASDAISLTLSSIENDNIKLNFKKISTDYKSNFKGCSIDLQKTEVSRDCQEGSEPTEQAGMQIPRKDSGRSQ